MHGPGVFETRPRVQIDFWLTTTFNLLQRLVVDCRSSGAAKQWYHHLNADTLGYDARRLLLLSITQILAQVMTFNAGCIDWLTLNS